MYIMASEQTISEENQSSGIRWRLVIWLGGILLIIAFGVGFQLVYAGRVLPGVSADGVYLGGLDRDKAGNSVSQATKAFSARSIQISDGQTSNPLLLSDLNLKYNSSAVVDAAINYGRRGNFWQRITEQSRSFFGRSTSFANYTYKDDAVLSLAKNSVDNLSTYVSNARFSSPNGNLTITSETTGTRVDPGQLILALDDRLGSTSTDKVYIPTYTIQATVNKTSLLPMESQARNYLSSPIQLAYIGQTKLIDTETLASWLHVTGDVSVMQLLPTYEYPVKVSISLNKTNVAAYVSNLATEVNQVPIDGTLTVDSTGSPIIAIPGRDGRTLNQTKTISAITDAIMNSTSSRKVDVEVAIVKPAVSQDTLANLGIKDHLSQGISYFPGSDANRITNVRVGASKFNGALIKPGATFSFNTILGDIGPEFGYAPGYVILGDHEEKQYGGGLCQVSSTAYRAALLAGFPITARTNHSFAVSWYTRPFGVPGVDATIYLPNPDFKFVNDSPGYLFIQTKLTGTTLTFDFYGTKTKSGRIRGPVFVSGSLDATQPSHTVFYRDVMDLSGNVIKTDTVDTYYKSSLLYPVTSTH
jgi:vancomycin resistance protein YoaR